jgi:hypothetical protein
MSWNLIETLLRPPPPSIGTLIAVGLAATGLAGLAFLAGVGWGIYGWFSTSAADPPSRRGTRPQQARLVTALPNRSRS